MHIDKGEWIFTCSMKPKQFDYWDDEQEDNFHTIDGSYHSRTHCGLVPITKEYAEWFIKNECDKLFDPESNIEDKWDIYINKVKVLCERDNINFEGV